MINWHIWLMINITVTVVTLLKLFWKQSKIVVSDGFLKLKHFLYKFVFCLLNSTEYVVNGNPISYDFFTIIN